MEGALVKMVAEDGGVVEDGGGVGRNRENTEKESEKRKTKEKEVYAKKPTMPLHFIENYENALGVVFVSKIMCLVIISQNFIGVHIPTSSHGNKGSYLIPRTFIPRNNFFSTL